MGFHRTFDCITITLIINELVRYLVQEDEQQFLRARKLIRAALRAGETLYIPITDMLELEWVLRSNLKLSKVQATSTL